jgi:enamine deaminase RidA (YjgF/YER057c/UK114 family)
MPSIKKRQPGVSPTRSRGASDGNLVFCVAIAIDNENGDMYGQTKTALARIDDSLSDLGSDKRHILLAVVYIADIKKKDEMNRAWNEWVDPTALPVRACQEGKLEGKYQVEIVVTAAVI